ncbi:MAG: FixH family protein [Kofleriaceae bacterium]
MSPGTRWIVGVIATLAATVAAMVVLIVFAERATAGRVVPHYYERASHYDDVIAQADASRALGWTATVALTAGQAQACVHDRDAQPVRGTVEVTATHRAHPGAPTTAAATLAGDGCASLPMTLGRGVYDVTVTASAGPARFVATAAREVR